MPGKVVIVLEAQDREALTRIKEFGRGVQDTVDKLKAANPALEGTRVKVTQLTSAKVDAFKASQQWSGVLQVLPGQLGAVSSQASTLVSVLGRAGVAGGLIGGLTLAATAGVAFARSMANDIERLDNLSRTTGLSVDALEALEFAARQAGEAPETLARGFGRVNDVIAEVIAGKDQAAKAFEAIGVPITKLVKDGASAEEIISQTAVAIQKIVDPTTKAAAAYEIFGLKGKGLNTALVAIGEQGFPAYIRGLKEAGQLTDDTTRAMARQFDVMFDQIAAAAERWWIGVKARFASGVLYLMELTNVLREDWTKLFSTWAAMTDEIEQRIAQRLAPERPPGFQGTERTPRTTAPTAAETRALADLEKRAQEAASAIAQIFADLETEIAEQVLSPTSIAHQFEALDEAAKVAEQSLRDYTISLSESRETLLENNRVVDGAVGFYQQWGIELGSLSGVLGNLQGELTGGAEGFRLFADGAREADAAVAALQSGLSQRPGIGGERSGGVTGLSGDEQITATIERFRAAEVAASRLAEAQRIAALESGNAWTNFTAGFGQEVTAWGDSMTRFQILGAETARIAGQAFEESLFQLMKGNLDDFDDLWKTALDAVLQQIGAFIASEAVQALIKLGSTAIDVTFSSDGGSSGSWIDDFRRGIGLGQQRQAQQLSEARVSLAQERQTFDDEERRRIILHGAIGRRVGTTIGGVVGGAAGGASLGPVGAVVGAPVGAWLGGKIGDWLGDLVAGLAGFGRSVQDSADTITTTTGIVFGTNVAWDAYARAMDATTETVTDGMAAQTDLTAAQTDLAISTADVTASTQASTQGLNDLSVAANEFGPAVKDAASAVADAATAAEEAAGIAVGAAADAQASAASAASSASSAGKGFGPGGSFAGTGPGQSPGPVGEPGGVGGTGPGGGFEGGGGTGGGEGNPERQLGLLEGPVPGPRGAARRMTLHGGEVVATPDQAAAILAALRDPEDRRLMQEQNRLLKDLVRGLLRGGGRLAGAAV